MPDKDLRNIAARLREKYGDKAVDAVREYGCGGKKYWPGGMLLPAYPQIIREAAKKRYLKDYINRGSVVGYPLRFGDWVRYVVSPYIGSTEGQNMGRRALLAKYMGVTDGLSFNPDDYVEESPYRPAKATDDSAVYYRLKGANPIERQRAFEEVAGKYTYGKGVDGSGRTYKSLYDVWDLAPFSRSKGTKDEVGGTAIELYDRIYDDEPEIMERENQYKIKLEKMGASLTQPLQALMKSRGGKIHIKPSKRGTFTAAAKKHGKSVQAFASQVLSHKENYSPAMVKKANFARNAAKWHGEGGLIERLQKAYGPAALEKVIGVRKFALGGPEGEGGYTTSAAEREAVRAKWDPAHGFNIPGFLWSWSNGNQSKGEENEYWRAYLGLENNVPRMSPDAKTEWDDTIESDKAASGEPLSDFYGTTPRMDQMLQVLADTLNTGNIVRNYAAYKERYPELADKVVFEHMYDQGKQVLDNPGKWTQVVEGPQMYLDEKVEKVTNEKMPLGMLADFGMKWLPDEGKLMVHDTYDFPKHVTAISDIPVRPKEMKIRGRISFDPKKGSILLRNGVWHKDKYAEPIANKYSH